MIADTIKAKRRIIESWNMKSISSLRMMAIMEISKEILRIRGLLEDLVKNKIQENKITRKCTTIMLIRKMKK